MRAIPLVDLPALAGAARRTRWARLALAGVAVVLAAVCLLVAPWRATSATALLPRTAGGVVVLDVSASISTDTYARIAATLERIGREGGRAGLVLFSDTAYLALPPGTPVDEIRSYERFFRLRTPSQPGFQPQPPRSPFTDAFSAGTRISTGLGLALDVVRREHVRRPLVVLVSDLDDDAGDLESLTSVVLSYRRLHVPIRVVALNPAPEDVDLVARLLSRGGDLVQASLPEEKRPGGVHASPPTGLLAAASGLALVLAAFLVVTERVRWRQP